MTCGNGRLGAAGRLPAPGHRDRGCQQHWLRVLGAVEVGFRTVLGKGPKVFTHRIGRLFESGADHFIGIRQVRKHAERLGALTGEHQRDVGIHDP